MAFNKYGFVGPLTLAAFLTLNTPTISFAEPPPSATPTTTDPRAQAALIASREALAKLHSFAYTASLSSAKAGTTPAKPTQTDVILKKADAGGWKILARTTATSDAAHGPVAAYDGVSARTINDADKIIYEQTVETLDTIRAVFAKTGADPAVAWELLGEGNWTQAQPSLESPATIDGLACEVVKLTLPAAKPATAAPAPDDKPVDKPTDKPTAPADKPSPAPTDEVRLFISSKDHLPRRITRQSAAGPDALTTTINISALETDKSVPDSYFNIDTPAEYTVRRAFPPAPKPPKPARPERQTRPAPDSQASFALAAGDQAPAWSLKDPAGNDHKLADYKGKVVLMDFWGSWCPPCRAALPGIQKVHEHFQDRPVAVLGMNFEQRPTDDPAKFMKDKGCTYQLLLKAETIASDYKITGWPTFYILDQQGKVVWSATGYDASGAQEAQMIKVIDELLTK